MNKKVLFFSVILLVVAVLSGCSSNNDEQKIIGGDVDEHDCLVGAGYSWCPSNNQCQRMWEEYCPEFKEQFKVEDFNACVAMGNPVMESYPRQCAYNGQTFVEELGNTIEKMDKISLESPRPNDVVSSPLLIKGQARGNWFFEASFPIVIVDWDGLIIGSAIAQAQGDWMTEDWVDFTATLEFTPNTAVSNRGALILQRDNPSGLPEFDDALEIPVFFE